MAKNIALGTGCNDLPCRAEHGSFSNHARIIEKISATWCCITAKGEELADVGQKKIRLRDFT
jgi:hypothetical protein